MSAEPPNRPTAVEPALLHPNPVCELDIGSSEEGPFQELPDGVKDHLRGVEASSLSPTLDVCNESINSVSYSGIEGAAPSETAIALQADELDEVVEEEDQSLFLRSVDGLQPVRYDESVVADSNSIETNQQVPEIAAPLEGVGTTMILRHENDDEPSIMPGGVAVVEEPVPLPISEEAASLDAGEGSFDEDPRKLPRYRPPSPKPPNANRGAILPSESKRREPSWLQLDIVVRVTFDRYDFCAVHLLLAHAPDMDETVVAKYEDGSLELVAQEDWYQDLALEKLPSYLKDGIELKAILGDRRRARWALRGRDIYVLASHPDASGFVSTNRLVLERSHLVLCIEEQVGQVQSLLHEAGCHSFTQLSQSSGVPNGWILFRGVTPTLAIALDQGDQYYALKPAPDLEIEFEGGICIRNSVWLSGYPPQIKLFGQISDPAKILIDGAVAQRSPEGRLFATDFDSPGQHTVVCEGLSHSRSYSIEEGPESWDAWQAYSFGNASICGPLVQLPAEAPTKRMVCIPRSNPLLIGAEPGQVFKCAPRSVSVWKGLIPFDAVWALPAHPLICNKKTARIIQLTDLPAQYRAVCGRTEMNWCNAILDAARKGLLIESSFPDPTSAWAGYREAARRIRKRARR